MRRGRWWTAAAILSVSLALGGCGAASGPETEEKAPVPVEVVDVREGVVESRAALTGTLAPNETVHVAPKISGTLASLNVRVGQRVNAGDVLFTLDQDDLKKALDQAEAAYNSAVASLNQATASSDQGLVQAEAALVQAEQAYNDAKTNLDRTRELYEASFVSKQQLEQAEAAFKNAEASLANARKALEVARQKPGLQVAQASVEQSRLAVAVARDNLANAVVTAPIAGVVAGTSGNIGSFVSPQAPVVTLIDTSTMLVKVNVSEDEVTGIRVGDKVSVTVPAAGTELVATVRSVSPVMDAMVKAYPVEIALENRDDALKADMVAEVRFRGGAAGGGGLIVPRSAVMEEGGTAYVFKVEGSKAVRLPIETGARNSQWVEVTAGLAAGDRIVARGLSLLNDGDEIAIQN